MNLFFDLDGTLTDPKLGITSCIQYALTRLDRPCSNVRSLEKYIGPPLLDSFRELLDDDDLAVQAITLYRQRFSTLGMFENKLYAGITDCLNQLKHSQIPLFVVTSKPTVYAEKIIQHFNLADFFTRIYGSSLDGRLTNKSQLLRHVLQHEYIQAQTALMIGDRRYDIIGAKENGIATIGVSWGYGTHQELTQAGADRLCAEPNQLFDCIQTFL